VVDGCGGDGPGLRWLGDAKMTVVKSNQEGATVAMSYDEIVILNNALNEVCSGLDLPEFSTRMGCSREEAQSLLGEVHALTTEIGREQRPT